MKLSIIIPVYQVEEYIERCLKSIISQDCKDYEIILVDDATRDNSMQIAHDVLDNTGTIVRYLKHESNSGLSAALIPVSVPLKAIISYLSIVMILLPMVLSRLLSGRSMILMPIALLAIIK